MEASRERQKTQWHIAILGFGGGVCLCLASVLLVLSQHPSNGESVDLWRLIPGMLGLILLLIAARDAYDATPIPNEPLHAPKPVNLPEDQRWRKDTRLRFLEKLKREITQREARVKEQHKLATAAYEAIPNSTGLIAYKRYKSQLAEAEQKKQHSLAQLPELYERTEKISSGDVGHEILRIKEEIRKLERERLEQQRRLADTEKPCTINHQYQYQVDQCKNERERHREELHHIIHCIDNKIIELETDLEELQNFDFKELWGDLHLPGPPNLTRVPKERIDDLRGKVDTLNTIPELKKSAPQREPELTPEQKRQKERKACEARIADLKAQKQEALKIEDEDERLLRVNAIDAALEREYERWARLI
jgi:hypothetical protein